jgi:damage-control phosphatase, subfamily I
MKTYKECIDCFFRQARRTAKLVTDDTEKLAQIDKKAGKYLKRVSFDRIPADLSSRVLKFVCEVTGCADPYRKLKKKYNRIAKEFYPELKKIVIDAPDPILMGLKVAVAGNIIDLGILPEFDLDKTIRKAVGGKFPMRNYKKFRKVLEKSEKILYIMDNSGEIFFDKPLIEELVKTHDVTVSVKSGPILNDATMEDARAANIAKIAKVVPTGNSCLGVDWRKSSQEFKKIFNESDLIISKGQANYETLDGMESKVPIFFLLQSKCPVVARYVGVKQGDIIFNGN